jgi:hypothetical protein
MKSWINYENNCSRHCFSMNYDALRDASWHISFIQLEIFLYLIRDCPFWHFRRQPPGCPSIVVAPFFGCTPLFVHCLIWPVIWVITMTLFEYHCGQKWFVSEGCWWCKYGTFKCEHLFLQIVLECICFVYHFEYVDLNLGDPLRCPLSLHSAPMQMLTHLMQKSLKLSLIMVSFRAIGFCAVNIVFIFKCKHK